MKKHVSGFLFLVLASGIGGCGNADSGNTGTVQNDTGTVVSNNTNNRLQEVAVKPQNKPAEGQYCYINKVYSNGGVDYIEADYIQFLMGDEAVSAARKRGDAERIIDQGDTSWAVPNDYYIINENRKSRTLVLAKDFRVIAVEDGSNSISGKDPLGYIKKKAESGVFILSLGNNDTVLSIKEQYLP